jgi:predicted RNase H-like nuclease (RuvC/YqgF family)
MPRISAAQTTPARVTQPTYEKLKARVAALETKLTAKSAELQTHKDIMARSRYTPQGLKDATAKLKKLEKEVTSLKTELKQVKADLARLRPASKPPTSAELTAVIEKNLKSGTLEFNGKAPKKEDILTQTEVNKRPFSYTAIVLKSDPNHVIIKKVLTGGFVPARPGDGSFSQPVPLR